MGPDGKGRYRTGRYGTGWDWTIRDPTGRYGMGRDGARRTKNTPPKQSTTKITVGERSHRRQNKKYDKNLITVGNGVEEAEDAGVGLGESTS